MQPCPRGWTPSCPMATRLGCDPPVMLPCVSPIANLTRPRAERARYALSALGACQLTRHSCEALGPHRDRGGQAGRRSRSWQLNGELCRRRMTASSRHSTRAAPSPGDPPRHSRRPPRSCVNTGLLRQSRAREAHRGAARHLLLQAQDGGDHWPRPYALCRRATPTRDDQRAELRDHHLRPAPSSRTRPKPDLSLGRGCAPAGLCFKAGPADAPARATARPT